VGFSVGLGVADERVYLDHGLTGTNHSRPGLNSALAVLRERDTLVVPKLDRLARSVPDARAIGDSLAARGVRLSLGGSVYDAGDPMGKCFFSILAAFAEFEVDLLRMRTREGLAIARAKGRLKGKAPKLSRAQGTVLLKLHAAGEHSIAELAEFPRRVVGWQLASHMRTTLVLDALRTALGTRRPGADVQLVSHSDAGSQYTSADYQQELTDQHGLASIDTVSDAYDNALAESFVGMRLGGELPCRERAPGQGRHRTQRPAPQTPRLREADRRDRITTVAMTA
jgi:hypothetical protein